MQRCSGGAGAEVVQRCRGAELRAAELQACTGADMEVLRCCILGAELHIFGGAEVLKRS